MAITFDQNVLFYTLSVDNGEPLSTGIIGNYNPSYITNIIETTDYLIFSFPSTVIVIEKRSNTAYKPFTT